MTVFAIRREASDTGGRWLATMPGRDGEAELSYVWQSQGVIRANHTYAPPHLRGTGIAQALVQRLIADARAEGFRINPSCPYIRLMFEKHPEWADLWAR